MLILILNVETHCWSRERCRRCTPTPTAFCSWTAGPIFCKPPRLLCKVMCTQHQLHKYRIRAVTKSFPLQGSYYLKLCSTSSHVALFYWLHQRAVSVCVLHWSQVCRNFLKQEDESKHHPILLRHWITKPLIFGWGFSYLAWQCKITIWRTLTYCILPMRRRKGCVWSKLAAMNFTRMSSILSKMM